MRTSAVAAAMSAIVFGVAGLVSTGLQLSQQTLGFEDTDSPAVNLAYLRAHFDNYLQQGLAMFVMAIALTILVFATWDLLAGRSGSLALRTVSTFGLVAAACFFLFGVLRYGVHPLLYIDGLNPSWGELAYLVQQIAGRAWVRPGRDLHDVQLGARRRRPGLPIRRTASLALRSRGDPAFRLLGIVGPLLGPDSLPGGLWIVFMVSIPGSAVWFVLLGTVLLRRGIRSGAGDESAAEVAAAHG